MNTAKIFVILIVKLFLIPGLLPQTQAAETPSQPLSHLHLFSFMVLALNVIIVAAVTVRHFVNQRTDHRYQRLQVY